MLWSQALGLWHGTLHAPAMAAFGHQPVQGDAGAHAALHPHPNLQGHAHAHAHADAHPATDRSSNPSANAAAHVSAPASPPAAGWVDDHAVGDAECRLLDQLLHADVLAPPPGPILASTSPERPVLLVDALARHASGWLPQARGPPPA